MISKRWDWKGTWLSAAFLGSPHLRAQWPSMIQSWRERELLGMIDAVLVNIAPTAATYDRLQDPSYLALTGQVERDISTLESHFAVTLNVIAPPVPEVRIDFTVNKDNSVVVTVSVPYQAWYEELPSPKRDQNLETFVDVCCRFFLADLFIVGRIGEEVRIPGYASLTESAAEFTDWAFYGTSIAKRLTAIDPGGTQSPKLWRQLEGGLFVTWEDWDSRGSPPSSWRSAVAGILADAATRLPR